MYIINSEGIAYHPQLVAVYHQAVEKYTLKRDEIQPIGLTIYTALRAVMIYQAYGLDKKRTKHQLRSFLVTRTGIEPMLPP